MHVEYLRQNVWTKSNKIGNPKITSLLQAQKYSKKCLRSLRGLFNHLRFRPYAPVQCNLKRRPDLHEQFVAILWKL